MKMRNRIPAFLLALIMVFSLTIVTASAGTDPVTIFYTNDVHTYINNQAKESTLPINYATVAALKQSVPGSLLVDAGDHIQGTAYGGMDQGKSIIELMNATGYDVATLGNHEFDYDMPRLMTILGNDGKGTGEASFPYVSCNFYKEADKSTVLDPYKIFTVNTTKVAFVGVTTPESFTKSTPKYFQDTSGNYIYGISGGADGTALYTAVQEAIDAAIADGADYVIGLGHLGVDPSSAPWRSTDVIAHVSGLNAFIDGHSHNEIASQTVTDKDGNDVILSQTGNYLNHIGEMTIASDGTITARLLKRADITPPDDAGVKTLADTWINDVSTQLGTKIAESDIPFRINDDGGKRLIRKQETNLGDLNADAYYWYLNEKEGLSCDVAIMNGGGIRADVAAGDWTYQTCKTVNTFGNVLCMMEVTGEQILNALEMGARSLPDGENGGFLHVAGMTYRINKNLTSGVNLDSMGIWQGMQSDAEHRVYDVQVYNKTTQAYEPLDLAKTYTMAGTNYTIRNQGDGFAMFEGATLVKDYVCEDYLAMAAYLKAFRDTDGNGYANISTANSPLHAYANYLLNYEDLNGAQRIMICPIYDISDATVTAADAEYTGNPVETTVTVVWHGQTLQLNQDYTLSYTNNQEAGTATVTVNGIDEYYGTASANFLIKKAPAAPANPGQQQTAPATGDTGVVLYVGLAVLSMAGTAVLVSKKKKA